MGELAWKKIFFLTLCPQRLARVLAHTIVLHNLQFFALYLASAPRAQLVIVWHLTNAMPLSFETFFPTVYFPPQRASKNLFPRYHRLFCLLQVLRIHLGPSRAWGNWRQPKNGLPLFNHIRFQGGPAFYKKIWGACTWMSSWLLSSLFDNTCAMLHRSLPWAK